MKWVNEKCKNFNIYTVLKKFKKHLDISLIYTCVSKILMIWSTVLEIECDRLKLVIKGHFLPFLPSLESKKIRILKKKICENEKGIWRCHHFTHVYQKWWASWEMKYDRWFFVILSHFFAFLTHYWAQKNKIWKNITKPWRYYPFTYVCHKWKSYEVWFGYIRHDRQLFCYFWPFSALLPQYWPWNLKFRKM